VNIKIKDVIEREDAVAKKEKFVNDKEKKVLADKNMALKIEERAKTLVARANITWDEVKSLEEI
jgi:hypothetical protein